jgi:hypothetical protein
MPHRLGHRDLAGTFGAANITDGGGEQLDDLWDNLAHAGSGQVSGVLGELRAASCGHHGTVPRATVKDDPSGHETWYRGVSSGPFG